LLVSSPLKRTVRTPLFGFKKQIESGIKVVLLAELQEAMIFHVILGVAVVIWRK